MAIERYQYSTRVVLLQVILNKDMMGGNRQWIPLKLNASGVMPIIFAQAIMFIPAAVLVYLSQIHRSPLLALLVICSVLV
jgi:preprotein translocase subunit SecY